MRVAIDAAPLTLSSGGLPRYTSELALALRMSQPRVSWHLRMLELGGVVTTRREGRLTYCSVDLETIRRRLTGFESLLESRTARPVGNLRREISG